MADKYGPNDLPLPVAVVDGSFPDEAALGDALLGYVGDYIKKVMETYAGEAWDSVQPGTPIVRTVRTDDPIEEFNTADLPCLYVYRPSRETRELVDTFESIAEDYRMQKSRVAVRWILDPCTMPVRRARNSIMDGVRKAIDAAVMLGRDPSWIVPSDVDTDAPTYGSNFSTFAGVASFELVHAQSDEYVHHMQPPAPPQHYDELKMSFDAEELLVPDLTLISDPDDSLEVDYVIPDLDTGYGDFDLGSAEYE